MGIRVYSTSDHAWCYSLIMIVNFVKKSIPFGYTSYNFWTLLILRLHEWIQFCHAVFSVIDHIWHEKCGKNKKVAYEGKATSSYQNLASSVIYYHTDPWQHGLHLFNMIKHPNFVNGDIIFKSVLQSQFMYQSAYHLNCDICTWKQEWILMSFCNLY